MQDHICSKKKILIQKDDNYMSISNKLANLGSITILDALEMIEKNNFKWFDQDETQATYAKKILKKESEVDWNQNADQLIAKIKGLNPFPGVWFKHKNIKIKIIDAIEVNQSGDIGEILDENLIVACKNNAIKILSIQKEGKKILKTKEFISGYKIEKGEHLN